MAKKQQYDFMGPNVGPIAIMAGLPVVNFMLWYGCNATGCATFASFPAIKEQLVSVPLATPGGFAAVAAWLSAQILLHVLLPGRRAQGEKLPDGTHLTYKLTSTQLSFFLRHQPVGLLAQGKGPRLTLLRDMSSQQL